MTTPGMFINIRLKREEREAQKTSFQKQVKIALAFYEKKFGIAPNHCFVPLAYEDLLPQVTKQDVVKYETSDQVPLGTIHISFIEAKTEPTT